ncbi:transcriptional regulator [Aspergillus ellipticus CBS 707.79]|uniref:Transcriptional regulator n=1 Tax=Aspergillus ellipticus CBS 707.79 TaxID=1448320 RepID=A0A319DGJ8_9EURO|nr:transcriptional regulator [Aspergillus ellipticus CBS 707.79]
MYLRAIHTESHIPTLQNLISTNPLGLLTTAIKSPLYPLLQTSHIPLVLDIPAPSDSDPTPPGTLRGHIAKQNPQAKALIEALTTQDPSNSTHELADEVLVLFNGAHNHYVTPKFYTETKPATGKVVPTWNYAAVQAYGKIRVYWDSRDEETGTFLQKQVEDLTRLCEGGIMGFTGEEGRKKPWGVEEAPVSYVEILKRNIVGIEIRIERLQGKFKMNQEMGNGDREGVVEGFEGLGSEVGLGMAGMVRERGELKDREKKV